MLINTIILFLKDLLPSFILLCFIGAVVAPSMVKPKQILLLTGSVIVGVLLTFFSLSHVGDLYDGRGIEVIQTIELLCAYLCLVVSSTLLVTKQPLSTGINIVLTVGITLLIVVNSNEFVVFLNSYIERSGLARNIVAGLVMGLGICLSFSALLYFLLVWLRDNQLPMVTYLLWSLFLSGQVSQVVKLLQQVDLLSSSHALWNTLHIVKDSSEYGQLLKTAFGYEARPSVEFVIFYLASLLFIIIYYVLSARLYAHKTNESPKGISL